MRRRTKQSIDAEVLSLWRARFALLGEKLAQNSSSEYAWFWRVQWDILNYLLHRYGGDTKQTEPGLAAASTVAALATAENPTMLRSQPSGSFAAYAGFGKMPRASGQIRPILQKIVEGNQERYELLEQLRKEMVKAQALFRLKNLEWVEWAKEYLAAYELLGQRSEPLPEQLTDEEIVDILCEMMEMDAQGEMPPGVD